MQLRNAAAPADPYGLPSAQQQLQQQHMQMMYQQQMQMMYQQQMQMQMQMQILLQQQQQQGPPPSTPTQPTPEAPSAPVATSKSVDALFGNLGSGLGLPAAPPEDDFGSFTTAGSSNSLPSSAAPAPPVLPPPIPSPAIAPGLVPTTGFVTMHPMVGMAQISMAPNLGAPGLIPSAMNTLNGMPPISPMLPMAAMPPAAPLVAMAPAPIVGTMPIQGGVSTTTVNVAAADEFGDFSQASASAVGDADDFGDFSAAAPQKPKLPATAAERAAALNAFFDEQLPSTSSLTPQTAAATLPPLTPLVPLGSIAATAPAAPPAGADMYLGSTVGWGFAAGGSVPAGVASVPLAIQPQHMLGLYSNMVCGVAVYLMLVSIVIRHHELCANQLPQSMVPMASVSGFAAKVLS